MVQYLASSVSRPITVVVAQVGTTLSIIAPAQVTQGEVFDVYGQLTRNDTGVAIPNATISLTYNGSPIGSAVTDLQGVYTIPVSIPSPGTYTLTANFAGMTVGGVTFGSSIATTVVGLGDPIILPLIVMGAAVITYVLLKK